MSVAYFFYIGISGFIIGFLVGIILVFVMRASYAQKKVKGKQFKTSSMQEKFYTDALSLEDKNLSSKSDFKKADE